MTFIFSIMILIFSFQFRLFCHVIFLTFLQWLNTISRKSKFSFVFVSFTFLYHVHIVCSRLHLYEIYCKSICWTEMLIQKKRMKIQSSKKMFEFFARYIANDRSLFFFIFHFSKCFCFQYIEILYINLLLFWYYNFKYYFFDIFISNHLFFVYTRVAYSRRRCHD